MTNWFLGERFYHFVVLSKISLSVSRHSMRTFRYFHTKSTFLDPNILSMLSVTRQPCMHIHKGLVTYNMGLMRLEMVVQFSTSKIFIHSFLNFFLFLFLPQNSINNFPGSHFFFLSIFQKSFFSFSTSNDDQTAGLVDDDVLRIERAGRVVLEPQHQLRSVVNYQRFHLRESFELHLCLWWFDKWKIWYKPFHLTRQKSLSPLQHNNLLSCVWAIFLSNLNSNFTVS